jgi:5'-methylthioinosine phosphorylase
MLGIIGGTGLTELTNLNISKRLIVRTPYGKPSQPLVFGEINGKEVVFLARHGGGHTIPPHAVNYRANIWALHSVGVTDLLAVATVGGISNRLIPGDIVLPHQILDYTYGRDNTYHDGVELPVRHIDFTLPYSQAMRERCLQASAAAGCHLVEGGIYACVHGPRLEPAAEIDRYERDGATIVGMTGMPEAALARELGVAYAAICPVANFAAGRGDSAQAIHFEQVMPLLQQTMDKVRCIIAQCLSDHQCATA